jgi:hypothetical protein
MELWQDYIEYALGIFTECLMSGSQDVSIEDVRGVFAQATSACSYHLVEVGALSAGIFPDIHNGFLLE